MTNFENITKSAEALGLYIGKIIWCGDCPAFEECKNFAHFSGECESLCVPKIIEWLEQETDKK